MQLGAHFAGMAIEQSMLGAAHACANPLTARYDITHGLALAILLPHVVRWNAAAARDRYAALLGSPRRRARDEDAAETLARRLEDLPSAGGLAMTLSDSGVEAERAARARGRRRAAVDRHVQPAAVRRRGRDGDLPGGAVAGSCQLPASSFQPRKLRSRL